MMRHWLPGLLLLVALLCVGGKDGVRTYPDTNSRARRILEETLPAPYESLKDLHQPLAVPQPGDWLAEHREKGQSFTDYQDSGSIRPDERRRLLKVLPLGEFSPKQTEILRATEDYLGRFFGVQIAVQPRQGLRNVPADARRTQFGHEQILTGWVRDALLRPLRRGDTLACIAFTSADLWPGAGWNFVFGEASISDRVGVWSLYRNGDPDASPEEYALCLRRTLATGAHETAHLLGIRHCIAYECLMNGSNHREEADRKPLFLCPNCLTKLCWNTGQDPIARYRTLLAFYQEHQMKAEGEACVAHLARLGATTDP